MQAIISQPYGAIWNVVPKSPADWNAIVDKSAAPINAGLYGMRDQLRVAVQPTTIAGVKAFIVMLKEVPPANRDLVFFFVDTASTEIYTLSLHDALPISMASRMSESNVPITVMTPI